jgi:hypothetical protein
MAVDLQPEFVAHPIAPSQVARLPGRGVRLARNRHRLGQRKDNARAAPRAVPNAAAGFEAGLYLRAPRGACRCLGRVRLGVVEVADEGNHLHGDPFCERAAGKAHGRAVGAPVGRARLHVRIRLPVAGEGFDQVDRRHIARVLGLAAIRARHPRVCDDGYLDGHPRALRSAFRRCS